MNASFWSAVATAFLSSTGLWGVVQVFVTRRQRHEDEARKKQEQQDAQSQADLDRRQLLAEAQATAQRTALESANARYDDLHEDYVSCRDGLISIRDATVALINAFETLLSRSKTNGDGESYTIEISVSELGESRRAINEARRHLR